MNSDWLTVFLVQVQENFDEGARSETRLVVQQCVLGHAQL